METNTYFIGGNEYSKCCDYRIVEIKKIRHCHQCLEEIKIVVNPPYTCPSEGLCNYPNCGCEWIL